MNWIRWVPLLVIVLLSGLFAYYNGGERITLGLGFATLYRVSLVGVVFGAFILGMISMFLIGLRQDLRLRRQLRERGMLPERTRPYEPPRRPAETRFREETRSREEPPAREWVPPA